MGTMGADFIQYVITDPIASPLKYESHYSEKFIYLPNSFMANSFSYLEPEILPPILNPEKNLPQEKGCGGAPATFVYCNFNKQLKFDPFVFRSWLRSLQNVDGSILCLQKNPADSIKYLQYFTKHFNKTLVDRVRFVDFDHTIGPFETKIRVETMCNAVLDNFAYNAHTTAIEALWAGYLIYNCSNYY
jgi:predicted O-linked N-acetylglucosamine transferase (SPINDLY family)